MLLPTRYHPFRWLLNLKVEYKPQKYNPSTPLRVTISTPLRVTKSTPLRLTVRLSGVEALTRAERRKLNKKKGTSKMVTRRMRAPVRKVTS